jgi:pheromone shutdown protein TraB
MILVRLLPPAIAALVLAAHFYRAGNLVVAGLAAALVALLFVPRGWAARIVQLGLAVGALEWVLTLVRLIEARQSMGQPYARLALILGAVALGTALSALVFRARSLRQRFRLP